VQCALKNITIFYKYLCLAPAKFIAYLYNNKGNNMQQRTITGITTRQTQHGNVAPRRLSHPPKKGRKYCINGETRIKYYAYAFSVSGAHKLNKTQCWVGPQSLSGCCESFPWHPDFSRCGAWLGPPSPATPTFVVSSIKKQRQPAKTKGGGQTNALIFCIDE